MDDILERKHFFFLGGCLHDATFASQFLIFFCLFVSEALIICYFYTLFTFFPHIVLHMLDAI